MMLCILYTGKYLHPFLNYFSSFHPCLQTFSLNTTFGELKMENNPVYSIMLQKLATYHLVLASGNRRVWGNAFLETSSK